MTMSSSNGKHSKRNRMINSKTTTTMVMSTMITIIIIMITPIMFKAIQMIFLQTLTNPKRNKKSLNNINKFKVKIYKAKQRR